MHQVAFQFNLSPARRPSLAVVSFVTPAPGFYCYVSALLASMLFSRMALIFHKQRQESGSLDRGNKPW
jgi:hypothetical protein